MYVKNRVFDQYSMSTYLINYKYTGAYKIWYKIIMLFKMLVLFYSVVLTTKSVAPISQVIVMLLLFFLFIYICILFASGFSAQVNVYVCAVTHRWCVSRLGSGARAMGQWIGRRDGLYCRRPIVMANGFVSSRLDSRTDTRVRCVKKERSSYSYKPLLTKYKIYYTKTPLIFLYTNICIPTTLTRSVFFLTLTTLHHFHSKFGYTPLCSHI